MATATYCDWTDVRTQVAASLFVAVADLHPGWNEICPVATRDAAAELKRLLILKGYTPAQIAASDDAGTWNERLGAFFAFVRGTALAPYDLKAVEHLDCRKDILEAGALVIDDKAVGPAPNESEVGGITTGQISATEETQSRFGTF